MPSRLSSLLVRDGLVGVKRMEKAFQRQVIYGGSLDTILLEMSLVPEPRLVQYLALASGLPPAGPNEGSTFARGVVEALDREIAAQFRAMPLSFDGEALRVLVCSPLEISALEDLADLLDRPLQPLITLEYRWHLAYARAYGTEAPARFTTLARTLAVEATPPPAAVGRQASVIVDHASTIDSSPISADSIPAALAQTIVTAPLVAPPRPPTFGMKNDPTAKLDAIPTGSSRDDATEKIVFEPPLPPSRQHAPTLVGVQPISGVGIPPRSPAAPRTPTTPPVTAPPVTAPPSSSPLPPAQHATSPAPAPDPISSAHHATSGAPPTTSLGFAPAPDATSPGAQPAAIEPATPASVTLTAFSGAAVNTPVTPSTGVPRPVAGMGARPSLAGRPAMMRTAIEPIATAGRDSPLAVVRARELLATAEDRDTVFLTLLRAARARARYAGLLTVQGGAAIGRLALAEVGIDVAQITTVLVPLDASSAFRGVVQGQQPYIGPLVSGDPNIDAMILRMGGTLPPSALLLPIVLRERVIAIVIAHRSHSDLKLRDVTELLPLAAGAADALGRLIVKHKSAGYRAPNADAPKVEIADDVVDTKKIVRGDPSEKWRVVAPHERPSLPAMPTAEPPAVSVPPRVIGMVLDAIENGAEGTIDRDVAEAVERASETLPELVKRFPGKLRIDRFSVAGRPLRASQYGGLLELVVKLGPAAGDLLVERLGSANRDDRFYATVCAAEVRLRTAVFALVERLFDQDYGVRTMASEALAGYPPGELAQALPKARRALHSSDPETVAAATTALVHLGDVDAIEELIGALERGDRGADHVRKALVALTAQDFGTSERKWRKWYDGARRRHRIEWLIDGLAHKDDAIREAAINTLRRLTGEYFGYHHDLPRKEREVAAERWSSWWRETGRRRFVTTA